MSGPTAAPPPDLSQLFITNGNGGASTGGILTGKQEHCKIPVYPAFSCELTNGDLKRELISRQVKFEINELNSPTALQRFGAPFRSPLGEVAPVDSELPILRYIFVNHTRNFPFLDRAREKEFWQDRLQVVRPKDVSFKVCAC
jgi:hypothetical protein